MTLVKKDEETRQWLSIVKESCPCEFVDPAAISEILQTRLLVGKSHLTVTNLYVPPIYESNEEEHRVDDFDCDILEGCRMNNSQDHQLMAGDLNGHHPAWDATVEEDDRGTIIVDWLRDGDMGLANDGIEPTFRSGARASTPDITLFSQSITNDLSECVVTGWKVEKQSLDSDHFLISFAVEIGDPRAEGIERPRTNRRKTRFAMKKMDIPLFQKKAEFFSRRNPLDLEKLNDVHYCSERLTNIIQRAAKEAVPRGCRKDPCPHLDGEVMALLQRRDLAKEEHLAHPDDAELAGIYREYCLAARQMVSEKRNLAWASLMESATKATHSGKTHTILKAILREPRGGESVALKSPRTGKLLHSDSQKASGFLDQYARISNSHGKRIPEEHRDDPRVYTAKLRADKVKISEYMKSQGGINNGIEGIFWKFLVGRTMAVMIDQTKAFDKVNHSKLMDTMTELEIPPRLVKWEYNFLRDRRNCAVFNGAKSKWARFGLGVPQGSVSGPILFDILMTTLADRIEILNEDLREEELPIINQVEFADDNTLFVTGCQVAVLGRVIQRGLDVVDQWGRDFGMSFANSTEAILFTTKPLDFHTDQAVGNTMVLKGVDLSIGTVHVPFLKTVRLLGIRLDNALTFTSHVDYLRKECSHRIMQLSKMTSGPCGLNPRAALNIYKGYVLQLLKYGSTIWSGFMCASQKMRLDSIHHLGLRVCLGVTRTTRVSACIRKVASLLWKYCFIWKRLLPQKDTIDTQRIAS